MCLGNKKRKDRISGPNPGIPYLRMGNGVTPLSKYILTQKLEKQKFLQIIYSYLRYYFSIILLFVLVNLIFVAVDLLLFDLYFVFLEL